MQIDNAEISTWKHYDFCLGERHIPGELKSSGHVAATHQMLASVTQEFFP